jgi:hypothetical protein
MLHVRVVSPVALTEQLTGRLATAPGVQNMVVRVITFGLWYWDLDRGGAAARAADRAPCPPSSFPK